MFGQVSRSGCTRISMLKEILDQIVIQIEEMSFETTLITYRYYVINHSLNRMFASRRNIFLGKRKFSSFTLTVTDTRLFFPSYLISSTSSTRSARVKRQNLSSHLLLAYTLVQKYEDTRSITGDTWKKLRYN